MNKAVFLDRDGVINYDPDRYTYLLEEFVINDGVITSLKKLYNEGYLLIVITNQGGIAKKLYTKEDVEKIHQFLISELKKEGISLTAIYYCPHHGDIENCICRKPSPLLIQKAIACYNIDPNKSYMIGDKMRDVEAAESAGIKGIKVGVNENIEEYVNEILK